MNKPICSRIKAVLVPPILATILATISPFVLAAPLTPGNLIIYRVGSGSDLLATSGSPVFLDEYSPSGAFIQAFALPTANAALPSSNRSLVANGTATSEGQITRSLDGRFLSLTGYNPTLFPYTSSLTSTSSGTVFRTIGRLDHQGTIDTSTVLQDFASGSNPRSAFTVDGSTFWVVGGAGGILYTPLGKNDAAPTTLISSTVPNLRHINAFGGQLYASSGAGTTVRVGNIGAGLPVTPGQTLTNLPGIPLTGSPYGFFIADLDAIIAGNDTLYVADDTVGLIKYSLVADTWVGNGVIGSGSDLYRGLTAKVSNNSVTLFAIRKAQGAPGGGELVSLTDTSGHNGAFLGEPTLLATASINTAFRGVALAPYSRPDLTVDLAAPTTAQAGSTFAYTLTLRNIGNVAASGISLGFLVPAGLTVGTVNGASGFSRLGLGNFVNFTGGSLAAGASATLTINVSSATAGTFAASAQAAFLDPSNTIVEADETNNGSAQVISTVVTGTDIAPTVTTGSASALTETTATLNGTINPNGSATTAQFEFGLSNTYGSTASVTLSPNNGSSALNVAANLTGLQAGQTYHYRLIATNSGGPGAGVDRTFSTYPIVPFTYSVTAGQVTITGYSGPGGPVAIPSTIVGLPVTAIAAGAFRDRTSITSVVIPNSVTSIGDSAFFGCSGLISVTLPNGLLSLGTSAFQSCISLTGIVIPNSVTDIGAQAFKSCDVLASATLPIGLTIIVDSLFHSCVTLSQVNIPVTVTSIETSAFQSCHNLVSITLPEGLATIGSNAFIGCRSLATVTIPVSVTSIGTNAFAICPSLTSAFFQGNPLLSKTGSVGLIGA